ncbi:hypothetical protein FOZ61_001823 [Perkinsus olseni]|uniref:Fibronectin type-III domain-containing protein n=1 Tax=Perkinsus olseni TaxID=32597 RepID=A0A7J6KPR0_PEROL|nr:hypothetical protein FOZ61_001823 [Perkinsus olseni]
MDDSRVSTPSIAILATTLSPTAPSAPGLSAFNTSTSSVSVLLVPPRFAHGSVVTSYELKYAPSTGQTPPTRWTSKTIQAGDISKPFTVSGLSTEQTIIFTATAVNGIGSSPASSPYSMKSDANGATAPGKVGTVSASNITSDSVLLKWPSTEDHGAMILRYVISINDTRTVEADGHNTNVTVTGLTRGTYYKFTIRAVNSRGQGEASDPISVKTLDLCNADPPSRPTAQAVFADENAAGWSSSMTKTITATTLDKAPSGVGCNTRDQVRWWMSVQNNDGQSLYYDGQKFTQEMIHCAVSTLGSVDGQAKCLTEYTEDPSRTPFHLKPISADCAHLMGVLGGCGKDKCFQQCFANPAAAACLDCNSRNCNGAFYKAAGLNRAIAPEFPKSR